MSLETVGAVHTHTHTHTGILILNNKQGQKVALFVVAENKIELNSLFVSQKLRVLKGNLCF